MPFTQVKTHFFVVLLVTGFLSSGSDDPRGVLSFTYMIKLVTGRRSLAFNNYGNWCGLGGGGEPVDDVDRCCMYHDMCYQCENGRAGHLVNYKWDYKDNIVTCRAEQRSECARNICECDRIAAYCFAESRYHPENRRSLLASIRDLF